MCEPSKNLKLCTCGTVEVSDVEGITWELRKFDEGLHICGESHFHYRTNSSNKLFHFLLSELNERQVFDFDYQAKRGDRLKIKYPKQQDFEFYYDGKRWMEDDSPHSFNGMID